jgi:hypothetical protein
LDEVQEMGKLRFGLVDANLNHLDSILV